MSSVSEKVEDLPAFIKYLEATTDEQWQVDIVRNIGNTKNCALGHFINYVYGPDYTGNISPAWDGFEWMWACDYMVYPVNDGNNPKYQQATPRERTIAYLKNLWLGTEKPTWKLWEEEAERRRP